MLENFDNWLPDELMHEDEVYKKYPSLFADRELKEARRGGLIRWYATRKGAFYSTLQLKDYLSQFIVDLDGRCQVTRPSWVYFVRMECEPPLVKIGVSGRLRQRITSIATTAGLPVRFLGCHEGDVTVERGLHERFKEYRQRGEWFLLSPDIQDYIDEHCHD